MVDFDEKVKVSFGFVPRYRSIPADDEVGIDGGGDVHVFAGWEAEGMLWSWESETEETGIVGEFGFLDEREGAVFPWGEGDAVFRRWSWKSRNEG